MNRRADKIFGHRLWMTPLASYVGFAAMLYGVYALVTGAASLWWVLPMLVCTFLILMGVTVGMHRLFCHRAFETTPFWHEVLIYLGTIAFYGSTIQWPAMHMSHHLFADTEKDPHYTGWRYLFWKKNRPTEFNSRVLRRLWQDPSHRFAHNYYVLFPLVTIAVLGLISPWALIFCYLIPLGWLHLVGSFHQVFAHGRDGAKDLPLMEVLMFTGGEWLHRYHHDWPKAVRFGKLDLGYFFIKLISVDRRQGA